jgi:hypothetical protein
MVKMLGVRMVGLHIPLARFRQRRRWHSPQLLCDICIISTARSVQQPIASPERGKNDETLQIWIRRVFVLLLRLHMSTNIRKFPSSSHLGSTSIAKETDDMLASPPQRSEIARKRWKSCGASVCAIPPQLWPHIQRWPKSTRNDPWRRTSSYGTVS